jgi:hypothetical protein
MKDIAEVGGRNRLAGRSAGAGPRYRRGLGMVGTLLAGLLTLSAGSAVGAPRQRRRHEG